MPLLQTSGNVTADGYGGGVAAVPNYIEDVFSTYLYTGNGSTQTITNGIDLSTKGGLVWIKRRDGVGSNWLQDTTRGIGKELSSNSTAAEGTSNYVTSANTDGFTVSSTLSASNNTYASWTFRKQPKFFDVVTYTGTGSLRTVSHSLGSVPGCIIIKNLSDTDGWLVYHRSIGATKTLSLNTTGAAVTDGNTYFNDTEPTSTQFTVNIGGKGNQSGNNYVAYLFAHDAGGFGLTGTDNVISCGSFTTNGSGNATVDLGYEPQWVLVKGNGSGYGWSIFDNMRGMPVTGNSMELLASSSSAEGGIGSSYFNPTATGFYMGGFSASQTYIYIAIRRGPMKVPTSGTSVFAPILNTGTGSAKTISGIGFAPDLLWDGVRNTAGYGNFLLDKLRGGSQRLGPYTTAAEVTESPAPVTQFGNTSINISGSGTVNDSGVTYVNWLFQRAPSFFDEVCYTGTGSARTVTHNLGVAPELMIVKRRDAVANWPVYTASTATNEYLFLNSGGLPTTATTVWNNTAPTSSVFSVGTSALTNASAGTYVAYLFSSCAGVSKVGSYTGTGALQTINCGFTSGARFVLIKLISSGTSGSGDWYVWDSARGISSGNDPYLLINSDTAETTGTNYVDTDTTGFKVTAAGATDINASGDVYLFLAIA